jgi:cysteine-rich repeat protein
MNTVGGIVRGLLVAAALFGTAAPARAQSVKASFNCRKTIGAKFMKVAQTDLGAIDACQKLRDKGKFTGDCNDLAQADIKGKIAKAEDAAAKALAKKCLAGDPVLFNYAANDPEGAFFGAAEDATEAAGAGLLGSPTIQGDKAKIKCHATISKAALKDVGEILKAATKCQSGLDKLAASFGDFGTLAGDCVATPAKAGPKGEIAIAKACCGKNKICNAADTGVDADIVPADVGSCDPLPACVTATSTATGQALATAIYGQPTPGCGNHIVDPGEECDDGNALATDGCIDCTLAVCGDGFVEAGVELCGDSATEACTAPSEGTCQVGPPCAAAGTTRTVTVRFSKPASEAVGALVVALDYPETQVRIPGSGGDSQVTGAVTVVPQNAIPTILDRDYEVQVSALAFGDIIAPGDFFSVQFDDCTAVTAPTLDEFACIVRSASDDGGHDITADVKCSITSP